MNHDLLKKLLLSILIVGLVAGNAITLRLYLNEKYSDDSAVEHDTTDEISRVKFFVKDWYDELSGKYATLGVNKNELQFEGGKYTLTVAADRIRAVYPRGERFFQMQKVTYVDFFELNGKLQCRIYYDKDGVYTFYLKNY